MARLDDLVGEISDASLRQRLEAALAELKRRQRFGLVFEEHIPETTALDGLPVQVGSLVQRRDDLGARATYRVTTSIQDGQATIEPLDGGDPATFPTANLLVVQRFGEPIFPALSPLGTVRCGPADQPHHAVINGENYHALQLLTWLYEGQVDCMYLDPPYNTGARDWKYNNHYVDDADAWRHSKWLSFMAKRLELAKRLLKPNGVLIVTIDENEVHHLGMLLESLFPDARRQMVTICINPSGVSGGGLSRVEEYALFCFLGEARPVPVADDMLTEAGASPEQKVQWQSLLRGGNTWYRDSRRNLCYPVLIDPERQRIIGVGPPLAGDDETQRQTSMPDGNELAWPLRRDGRLGIWRVDGARLLQLAEQGYAYPSSRDPERGTWAIKYLMTGTIQGIESGAIAVTGTGLRGEVRLQPSIARRSTAKTIWHRGRHVAGASSGTYLLAALLDERNVFPFPKSLYAVKDCLAVAIGDRPDALIVDCFAGSGTTLHATCLLNAQDGARRRSILVTNNEVDDATTRQLNAQGLYRGQAEFEAHGIFHQVTRPRCEAAITGQRPDGQPVEGEYLDGRPYAEPFPENVEFYRLDYLDPEAVDLGRHFEAILPALWLAAGGVGQREISATGQDFTLPAGSTYAVLFKASRFRQFAQALQARPEVTHVWLVTDSAEAYAEMRSALPRHLVVSMLYQDYLTSFRSNRDGRR